MCFKRDLNPDLFEYHRLAPTDPFFKKYTGHEILSYLAVKPTKPPTTDQFTEMQLWQMQVLLTQRMRRLAFDTNQDFQTMMEGFGFTDIEAQLHPSYVLEARLFPATYLLAACTHFTVTPNELLWRPLRTVEYLKSIGRFGCYDTPVWLGMEEELDPKQWPPIDLVKKDVDSP